MKLFLIVFISLLISSCRSPSNIKKNTTSFSGIEMTIPYNITIGKDLNLNERKFVDNLIRSTFDEINNEFNYWNPNSLISQFNRSLKNKKFRISQDLYILLKLTDKIVTLSKGRFDPTYLPVQKLWKKIQKEERTPTYDEISNLKDLIGWKHIHYDESFIWKDNDNTELDLCGIVKGYAIDLLCSRLSHAFNSIFIDWGGEIKTLGFHPEDRPWLVDLNYSEIGYIPLTNQALATSGDYINYWEQDSKTYFHIFDTINLRPCSILDSSLSSVTIQNSSCALADAIATTVMTFSSINDAEKWILEIQKEIPFYVWTLSHQN